MEKTDLWYTNCTNNLCICVCTKVNYIQVRLYNNNDTYLQQLNLQIILAFGSKNHTLRQQRKHVFLLSFFFVFGKFVTENGVKNYVHFEQVLWTYNITIVYKLFKRYSTFRNTFCWIKLNVQKVKFYLYKYQFFYCYRGYVSNNNQFFCNTLLQVYYGIVLYYFTSILNHNLLPQNSLETLHWEVLEYLWFAITVGTIDYIRHRNFSSTKNIYKTNQM